MKKFIGLILVLAVFTVNAQNYSQGLIDFYQPLGTNVKIDTVTDTGTSFVTTRVASTNAGPGIQTSVVVKITKISGTVGGTMTLQGSHDGTNFVALTTQETATALATITPADASATRTWRIIGNPYRFYRVSWTGTGTMSASFSATAYTK